MRPIALGRISAHMVNRIDELLPWRYAEFSVTAVVVSP